MTETGSDSVPLYPPWAALLAGGLLVLVACATQTNGGAARSGGNAETRLAPNRWSVSATGRTTGRATSAAWYRAAVLARAASYSHLQLLGYRREGFDYAGGAIQTKSGDIAMPAQVPESRAFLQVAGVNDPAAPLACAASDAAGLPCRNTPVSEILATFGPQLGRTPAETEAEVEAARRAPAVRPG